MNKQGVKSYIGIVIGLILSFNVGLYAWSGIQAQDGDKLSVAKWNELVNSMAWLKNGLATYYSGGYVGIGTNAPSGGLNILTNLDAGPNSPADGADLVIGDYNSYHMEFDRDEIHAMSGTNAFGTLHFQADGGNVLFHSNKGGGSEISILDNGNVGIGTNVPSQKFQTYTAGGPFGFPATSGTSQPNSFMRISGGDVAIDLGIHPDGRSWIQTSRMSNLSNNFAFIINPNGGNVGIGNTSPYSKLSVNSDVSTADLTNGYGQLILGGTTNSAKRLILGYETTANFGYLQGNTFGSTWDNIIINPRGGNVGIGIDPWAKLDINGSIRINGDIYGGLYSGTRGIWRFDSANPNHGIFYTEGTPDYVSISPNGGINTSPVMKIIGDGNARLAGTLTQSSDQRYKKDIVNISNSLNKLQNINGVYYKRKDETKSKQTQIGFIAQNLEKEFPELVSTDTNGYKSVNYSNMTAVLVEAVKELKKENEKKDQKIITLEKDNLEIKSRLNALENK